MRRHSPGPSEYTTRIAAEKSARGLLKSFEQPGLHGRLRAEAPDVHSAESLRDVIQGFLALARLQGGRDAAYRSMLDSVALTANGTSVSLSFDVSPAALDLLTPSGPALRGPTAPPRP